MGGETLLNHLERHLGIEAGATTADNAFTLLPCCCLGKCGDGPALMIGDRLFGPVSPEQAAAIIADHRTPPPR